MQDILTDFDTSVKISMNVDGKGGCGDDGAREMLRPGLLPAGFLLRDPGER